MKVCILVGAFLPVPAIKGGAVEKMWHQLGRTFVEKGHDVVMVSREYAGLARSEVHDGILHARVTGYDMPRNAVFIKALDFLYTRRALAAVPDDSDVVVTNSFWAPLLASQRLRRRMYVDVARMPKGQMRLYRGVGRLRANSAAVREAIMRELPLSDHGLVTIVPNPLPFVPNVENGGKSVASLLYVGRVHPEKGVHILLQALRRMRNPVALKLVGPFKTEEGGGGDQYLADLEKDAAGLPVEFVGPVYDTNRLAEIYRACSIFVYPSVAEQGETFGLAPLEAMAFGCVPVVSDLACFRDFVRDGHNGVVFNHRGDSPVESLSKCLDGLVEDAALQKKLSNEAKMVCTTHSPEIIADLFLRDFEAMAK